MRAYKVAGGPKAQLQTAHTGTHRHSNMKRLSLGARWQKDAGGRVGAG
ncbi:hypothetical protein [Kamptonema formosum]|nr:hypothetical protein [Oscillatoria sp. PCC 10802]